MFKVKNKRSKNVYTVYAVDGYSFFHLPGSKARQMERGVGLGEQYPLHPPGGIR